MAGRAGRKGSRKKVGARQPPRKPQRATRPAPRTVDPAADAVEWPDVFRPRAVQLLGVSDRTFTRLESEGVIRAKVAGAGGRQSIYDLVALHQSYLQHVTRQISGSIDTPRDRRDRSQAELNELRLSKERAELLPRDQVVREGQAFIKATMAKLRAIPPRLVRAGAIARDAEDQVAALIREAQEEMARWQTVLDLQRAVEDPAA